MCFRVFTYLCLPSERDRYQYLRRRDGERNLLLRHRPNSPTSNRGIGIGHQYHIPYKGRSLDFHRILYLRVCSSRPPTDHGSVPRILASSMSVTLPSQYPYTCMRMTAKERLQLRLSQYGFVGVCSSRTAKFPPACLLTKFP